MSGHHLIQTGGGWRCLQCGDNWDIGEDRSDECKASWVGTGLVDPDAYPFTAEAANVDYLDPRYPSLDSRLTPPVNYQAVKLGMKELATRLRGETPKLDTVIGFAGTKGSGKDTAASVLIEAGYQQVRFADCLKDMLRTLLRYRGVTADMIERYIEGDLKEEPCAALNGRTMRHAMQTLGDGWGRDMIHEDLWADATTDQINRLGGRVTVTDVRRPNEADALRRMGAAIIRIDRETGFTDPHASETSINQVRTDFVIHNDGTVDDLKKAVREHLVS